MEQTVTLGQATVIIGTVVGPILTALSVVFWQMRAASNKQVSILEQALIRSEQQADTLLPTMQRQVIAVDTTLGMLRRDVEETRAETKASREDMRALREDARILREELRIVREQVAVQDGRRLRDG